MDKREYQREWVRRRREAWLREHGPCSTCGSSQDLEVDHIDPCEKVSHSVWSWSEARRAAELAKCRVLCRSCHIERHRSNKMKHGVSRYRKGGRRCETCCAAMRKSWTRRRDARNEREMWRETTAQEKRLALSFAANCTHSEHNGKLGGVGDVA